MALLGSSYVTAELIGQLGNQLFIIAAATSLALDQGSDALFPQLLTQVDAGIPTNREKILFRVKTAPLPDASELFYREPFFHYTPLPHHPHLRLFGYFQSEKYFAHHRDEILSLFAPSEEIKTYLTSTYAAILQHPCTVAIHIRFYHEDPFQQVYCAPSRSYYEKAIALFPKEALFVIFSNDLSASKRLLSGLDFQMHFIEGEPYYHDFYLMSFCHHQIISNSSFSWWAAYLNPSPDKVVVAPRCWFNSHYKVDTMDLLPKDWVVLGPEPHWHPFPLPFKTPIWN